MVLFEYIPQSLQLDIANIAWVYNSLVIDAIIIPANPISKHYPDSIFCAALLQNAIQFDNYSKCKNEIPSFISALTESNLLFIPTIKTSNYTEESLQSAFLTLKYANLKAVAIVSGDLSQTSSRLTTNDALLLLEKLSKHDSYFYRLIVFCAIDSNITKSVLESFRKKVSFGVRNFITQPFYEVCTKHHSNNITNDSVIQNSSTFQSSSYQSFLENMHNYIVSVLRLDSSQIQFYCGFLPLMKETSAINLHNRALGIFIPKNYMQNIATDAINANIDIFNALKDYNCSISYIHFDDAKVFLESINS